jgi:hypothetical protein
MSGYLRNLIDRVSQRAPVLQRRRPALFEPVAPWARPPATRGDDSIEGDSAERTSRPAEEVRGVDAASPPAASQDLSQFREPPNAVARTASMTRAAEARPAEPVSLNAAKSDNPRHPMETRMSIDDKHSTAAYAAQPDAKGPARLASTIPVPRARPSPHMENKPYMENNGAHLQERSVRQPQPPNGGNTAATVSNTEKPQNDRIESSLLVPRTPPIARALQLAKASQAQATPRSPVDNSVEGDSVHISIGRVEVRAITGAEHEKPRAAKPRAPRLTLDDYLRERRGSRR